MSLRVCPRELRFEWLTELLQESGSASKKAEAKSMEARLPRLDKS